MRRTGPRLRRGIHGRALLFVVMALVMVNAGHPGTAAGQEEAPPAERPPFPHPDHQGLFPLCEGCHGGIPEGDRASFYPEVGLCVRCHNGVDYDSVTWRRPDPAVSLLRFEHPVHDSAAAGEPTPPACSACHAPAGAARMSVARRVESDSCWSCHAHEAREHYEDAACTTCHGPLAETGLPVDRIAALPVPSDHDRGGFLADVHGPSAEAGTARCATCHTRERCAACHVNAATSPEIQAVAPAPAGMVLPPAAVHYNTPASHEETAWLEGHEREASAASCSTCHTANDCAACHVEPGGRASAVGLPVRRQVAAPGVRLSRVQPSSHERVSWAEAHAAPAASDGALCSGCHTQQTCTACHEGVAGAYHPPNFVDRHAALGYGRVVECSTCHSTEAFCRSCHVESGLGPVSRLGPGFHDAQPAWLLRHGQAARQQLETCVSCHAQRDCLQCHSQLGAFRVNPHGPGFDAEAARERNQVACRFCHIGDPPGGGIQ